MTEYTAELNREGLFGYWLKRRRPEIADPASDIAMQALFYGPEAVVRALDTAEGVDTPEPTAEQLGLFAVYHFYAGLTSPRLATASEIQ